MLVRIFPHGLDSEPERRDTCHQRHVCRHVESQKPYARSSIRPYMMLTAGMVFVVDVIGCGRNGDQSTPLWMEYGHCASACKDGVRVCCMDTYVLSKSIWIRNWNKIVGSSVDVLTLRCAASATCYIVVFVYTRFNTALRTFLGWGPCGYKSQGSHRMIDFSPEFLVEINRNG